MQSHQKKLSSTFKSNINGYVIIFLIAVTLRTLPELLSGAYPVGFDTTQGYIPSMLSLPDITPMKTFGWANSPLAVYLLGYVYSLTKIDPNLLMKIAGPIFYGLFIVSFYYFLRKGLGWKGKMVFFVSVLFLLQPAVLRTGWDQLREELSLFFFFILLTQTNCNLLNRAKNKPLLISVLSILIVLSHQLISVLLLIVVIWQILLANIKKEAPVWKPAAVFFPSALIFSWALYAQFINPSWSHHFVPLMLQGGTGTFMFTNYFLSDPRFLSGNYLTVISHVGSLAFFTILPLIPFAIKGFFKDRVWTPILLWLIIASFSIVVYPKFALAQYWWWILLLPIPLTIYLGNYLIKIKLFEHQRRLRAAAFALAILALISIAYSTSTIQVGNVYSLTYSPLGLVESSIPIKDIPDAVKALQWANETLPANSTLIVPEKLQGTAYINIRSDIQIRIAQSTLTLEQVLQNTENLSNDLYAVYYFNEIGNNTGITKIEQFGSIEIFQILQS